MNPGQIKEQRTPQKMRKKISPTISWQISPTSHKFTALLRRGERRTVSGFLVIISLHEATFQVKGNLSRDRQNDIFADTDSTLVF